MIYFTADTHFGHTNIIKYCQRPFGSVEEMNETLINNWNSIVRPKDIVYHLGDFAFGDDGKYIDKLNGKICLICGGHDSPLPLQSFESYLCSVTQSQKISKMVFGASIAQIKYDKKIIVRGRLLGL